MERTAYQRTVEELEAVSSKFWPLVLSEKEAEVSLVPKLLETQPGFMSILGVPVTDIEGVFHIVNESAISGSLFLKHLLTLADVDSELLNRINGDFPSLFPYGTLTYLWPIGEKTKRQSFRFNVLPIQHLGDKNLGLSGKDLWLPGSLTALQEDVVALVLLGALCTDVTVTDRLTKCNIGEYVGQLEKLEKFISQRYIWTNQTTTGARSNDLSQFARQFVKQFLEENLNLPGVTFRSDRGVPGVQNTFDGREAIFGLVISTGKKYVAVEVCLQVTTNSTIEHKAAQALPHYKQFQAKNYKVAYVLDGAGNFERESAVRTICYYSHCTVAFSRQELELLCQFIRAYFMAD